MPNGTKEAIEEGVKILEDAAREFKAGSAESQSLLKEAREIRVLGRTARLLEAEQRLAKALEYASELRPPMVRAAEEMAERVPVTRPAAPPSLPAAAPAAAPKAHKPLTVEEDWTRDLDEFGSLFASTVRVWGIPLRRIVRVPAGYRNFVARIRAWMPRGITAFIGRGKRKIDLSLAEGPGQFAHGDTEAEMIAAAERMTADMARSGKVPIPTITEGGMIGKVYPAQGGKYRVEITSAPGAAPVPPMRMILDSYEKAIEALRRVLFKSTAPR